MITFKSGPVSTATDIIRFKLNGANLVTIRMIDIGSGKTIVCETSPDGTTWSSFAAQPTITTLGRHTFDVTGFAYFRVRVSVAGTGNCWLSGEFGYKVIIDVNDKLTVLTVAQLPVAAASLTGQMAYVTNASATTVRSVVAGGGANKVVVVCDGANWLIVS